MFNLSSIIKKEINVDNLLVEQDNCLINKYNPLARSQGSQILNLLKLLFHGILIKFGIWKKNHLRKS